MQILADEVMSDGMRKGQEFPEWAFWNMVPKQVPSLPGDLDDMCVFSIQAEEENWLQLTRDRRYFLMNTTKRAGLNGV